MADQDKQKGPPKHATIMDLDEAKKLVEANTGKGDISVTSRKIPDFVGKKDYSYFDIILTLRTSSGDASGLGTLATTTGADESEKNALIGHWESVLDLVPGLRLDFDALLAHIRASKDRKK